LNGNLLCDPYKLFFLLSRDSANSSEDKKKRSDFFLINILSRARCLFKRIFGETSAKFMYHSFEATAVIWVICYRWKWAKLIKSLRNFWTKIIRNDLKFCLKAWMSMKSIIVPLILFVWQPALSSSFTNMETSASFPSIESTHHDVFKSHPPHPRLKFKFKQANISSDKVYLVENEFIPSKQIGNRRVITTWNSHLICPHTSGIDYDLVKNECLFSWKQPRTKVAISMKSAESTNQLRTFILKKVSPWITSPNDF
jgi:hypothetical protein